MLEDFVSLDQEMYDAVFIQKLQEIIKEIKFDERYQSAVRLLDLIIMNPRDQSLINKFNEYGYELHVEMPKTEYSREGDIYEGRTDYSKMKVKLKYIIKEA